MEKGMIQQAAQAQAATPAASTVVVTDQMTPARLGVRRLSLLRMTKTAHAEPAGMDIPEMASHADHESSSGSEYRCFSPHVCTAMPNHPVNAIKSFP